MTEIDGVIQCNFYVVSFPFIVVLFDGIRKLTSIEVLWSLPLPTVPFFALTWMFDQISGELGKVHMEEVDTI